jgi:hypothetical protein
MNVTVEDRLTSRSTRVDPDVEATDSPVFLLDSGLGLFEQEIAGIEFGPAEVEIR